MFLKFTVEGYKLLAFSKPAFDFTWGELSMCIEFYGNDWKTVRDEAWA